MTCEWKRVGRVLTRTLSGTANLWNAGASVHCAAQSAARIPGELAKVAMIIVDRVGSEVPLSGEKGNCVQWR